jgi:putative FmdB family regulatory protein
MPIYEYQCAGCGRVVEKWQKVSESPLKDCPTCGGALHKLISSCSFQLKGSGWYVTDYAGKMASSNMAGTSKDSSPAATSDSGKTEAADATAPAKKIK